MKFWINTEKLKADENTEIKFIILTREISFLENSTEFYLLRSHPYTHIYAYIHIYLYKGVWLFYIYTTSQKGALKNVIFILKDLFLMKHVKYHSGFI